MDCQRSSSWPRGSPRDCGCYLPRLTGPVADGQGMPYLPVDLGGPRCRARLKQWIRAGISHVVGQLAMAAGFAALASPASVWSVLYGSDETTNRPLAPVASYATTN